MQPVVGVDHRLAPFPSIGVSWIFFNRLRESSWVSSVVAINSHDFENTIQCVYINVYIYMCLYIQCIYIYVTCGVCIHYSFTCV